MDSESHVLLAACGEDERAKEKDGLRLFKAVILHSLSNFRSSPIPTGHYYTIFN